MVRNACQQLNASPPGSTRAKALCLQPTINIAGAEETALADGHGIVDVDAMIVLGLLRSDDRSARGPDTVLQNFAVSAQRKVAHIRRIVRHGFRTGTIRSRAPDAYLAIHQCRVVNPVPIG